jgi:glucosamine-6-phosphate deaminase
MPQPAIHIVTDYAAVSHAAATAVADVVRAKPAAAVSVPTGSTPMGMFKLLAAWAQAGEVSFKRTPFFCLDEYVGIRSDDPASLTAWLMEHFFIPAQVPAENVHTLPTAPGDVEAGARQYERDITAAGGLELAVLGLGANGHIAYNEPGTPGDSRTGLVTLTAESKHAARMFFKKRPVPDQAVSVGVATLLEARQIVLMVSGAAKADILHNALRGPQTAEVPASFLQRAGERLTVIVDEAAAAKL